MDELARTLCRQLYECTDGRRAAWRKAVGSEAWLPAAMEQAVENGWLIVDDHDRTICCLTDEGRALARRSLS